MELKADMVIKVPAGADVARDRTYHGRIIEIYADMTDGIQLVRLAKTRPDGTPVRRWSRHECTFRDVTVAAFIYPDKVSVAGA